MRERCAELELPLAGPRWEIYGHWREDPDELETEVQYLLASVSAVELIDRRLD
ncbi:MAG TPA: hypothetical protein VNR66_16210 [Solirubrobacteraceae bacterium]|nr:hypothetical protein [Solirubrobacteraceae bacterium]